jgi:hypothetical protein
MSFVDQYSHAPLRSSLVSTGGVWSMGGKHRGTG